LQLDGSLGGALTLSNGATLSGNGNAGNVSINSGGTLAPGNSIGTLTINGNLTMNASSIYRVEANAAGASDKVVVNGTATLN
ncbi:autotransporter outer membrane beta-barrel domain-containing protein, partial [Mycobacterium tuberculosis]|nr:autotransporter outer membrane beta-barrel domain-containing protein [Mycobacterium tuberculosis]